MKRLKTKWFAKWAKKQELSNKDLLKAIDDLSDNLSSTSLGGGLFKVRIAMQGSGKSSAYRSIVVYRKNDRAVMVYGFAKNEQENLSKNELKAFKILSKDILALSTQALDESIEKKVFFEIGENDER